MDIVSLVQSFATATTYAVKRRQLSGFTRGLARDPVQTNITISASLQPATGRDLLRLPEGRRANETRVLFTTTEMFTGDLGETFDADLVTIEGDDWEIQHVEEWIDAGGARVGYRCILQAPSPESRL